jgi:hypothetical protein
MVLAGSLMLDELGPEFWQQQKIDAGNPSGNAATISYRITVLD